MILEMNKKKIKFRYLVTQKDYLIVLVISLKKEI
jgi:hypothetical protein